MVAWNSGLVNCGCDVCVLLSPFILYVSLCLYQHSIAEILTGERQETAHYREMRIFIMTQIANHDHCIIPIYAYTTYECVCVTRASSIRFLVAFAAFETNTHMYLKFDFYQRYLVITLLILFDDFNLNDMVGPKTLWSHSEFVRTMSIPSMHVMLRFAKVHTRQSI